VEREGTVMLDRILGKTEIGFSSRGSEGLQFYQYTFVNFTTNL